MESDFDWVSGLFPSSSDWEFVTNTRSFESSFTGATQLVESQGHHWVASLNFTNLTQAQQRSIRVIEMKSRGGTRSVGVPVFGYRYDGPDRSSEPKFGSLTNGDHSVIITTDWVADTDILNAGDLIAVNGELKTVLNDVTSNEEGEATIDIYPPMHQAPTLGDEITYNPPIVTMHRIPGSGFSSSSTPAGQLSGPVSAITMSFKEKVV